MFADLELRALTLSVLVLGLAVGPAPAASSDYNAVASTSGGVYMGPGTTQLSKLKRGEKLVVTKCTLDHWCFVERVGFDGWVRASNLRARTSSSTLPITGSRGGFKTAKPACTTPAGGTVCIMPSK